MNLKTNTLKLNIYFRLLLFLTGMLFSLQGSGQITFNNPTLECGQSGKLAEGSMEAGNCYRWHPTQWLDNPDILEATTTPESDITYTLTVINLNGPPSNTNVSVSVTDATPPQAMCKPITVTLDNFYEKTIDASEVDNGSTDNCGIKEHYFLENGELVEEKTFDCSDNEIVPVTLVVSDHKDNTASCVANVKVEGKAEITLEAEDGITECMEGRSVTFTANASDLPSNTMDLIRFTFSITDGEGNISTNTDWSIDKIEDHTFEMPDVPSGNTDHFYDAQIDVEVETDICESASDDLTLRVYELWIEYVRDQSSGRDWKVVAGSGINYKAIGSAHCTNWKWDFPEIATGHGKAWITEGGNGRSTESGDGGTPLSIKFESLGDRAKNDWFGDTYGMVKVSCKDGDGNDHEITSMELSPKIKCNVFFDPTVNTSGSAPSNSSPPSWFVYWKEGEVVDGMADVVYKHNISYGEWNGQLTLGPAATSQCGGPEYLNDMNGVQFTLTGEGKHLDCVAQTLAHENHHKHIEQILCSSCAVLTTASTGTVIPGHNDEDGIPDYEESNPQDRPFFPVSSPDTCDTFGYFYEGDYDDNEVRCRILERQPNEVPATHPQKDWSKSEENPQWKFPIVIVYP